MKTPFADKVKWFCNRHSMELAEYLLLERIAEEFSLNKKRLIQRTKNIFVEAAQSIDFPNFRCDNWNMHCDSLLAKNLFAKINAEYLTYVTDYLVANPALGPALSLPEIGELDLTLQGAALWKEIESNIFGWTSANPKLMACRYDKSPSHVQLFGTDQAFLKHFLEELLEDEAGIP
jgi:hypothetical protein